jgi:RNA polymerase primary sigma factor
MIGTISKLIRTSRQMVQELGREPTSENAKRLQLPVSKSGYASPRSDLAPDADREKGGIWETSSSIRTESPSDAASI